MTRNGGARKNNFSAANFADEQSKYRILSRQVERFCTNLEACPAKLKGAEQRWMQEMTSWTKWKECKTSKGFQTTVMVLVGGMDRRVCY